MEFNEGDFVKVDFDLYANGSLAETTDENKGKGAGLERESYGPSPIILGKNFILKALDDKILEGNESGELNLSPEEAYGERNKDNIKTFPLSVFREQKINPVVGQTYDFNGMYGKIKSNSGGRVMVDFNNPLAGKDIYLTYKVTEKLEDIKSKIDVIFETILRLPQHMYEISVGEDNKVTVKIPQEIESHSEAVKQAITENIKESDNYTIEIESFKKE